MKISLNKNWVIKEELFYDSLLPSLHFCNNLQKILIVEHCVIHEVRVCFIRRKLWLHRLSSALISRLRSTHTHKIPIGPSTPMEVWSHGAQRCEPNTIYLYFFCIFCHKDLLRTILFADRVRRPALLAFTMVSSRLSERYARHANLPK